MSSSLEPAHQILPPEVQAAKASWRYEREREKHLIMSGSPKSEHCRIQAIEKHLAKYYGSRQRFKPLMEMLAEQPPNVFWPALSCVWPDCDGTAGFEQHLLLRLMRKMHRGRPSHLFLKAKQRRFLTQLPERVVCYRGCSIHHWQGISWTTEKAVAANFAKGHRGIAMPDSVIVHALVHKSAIFFSCLEREESEIVLDPRFLRRVRATSYLGEDASKQAA